MLLRNEPIKRHFDSVPKVGQPLSSIRILITDDSADWRRQVRLVLQARPEWKIISEASDGLEAIQKAQDLKPEIILLDIGLPKLNGIEAARQIRQLSPSSKIVFLSQDNDPDVVQAALGTGAQGYVYKTDVRSDFLPAIQAAMRDRQFVSGILGNYEFIATSEGKVSIKQARYASDHGPLDANCHCRVCARYSRAYLRHLYASNEVLAQVLNTVHNLTYYLDEMRAVRHSIGLGKKASFLSGDRPVPGTA